MNASNAAKLFCIKNQCASKDKIIVIDKVFAKKIPFPKNFTVDEIVEVRDALEALLPLMEIVNDWIDIYNSRDKIRELIPGSQFFQAINYKDFAILEGMEKICLKIAYYKDKIIKDNNLRVGTHFFAWQTQDNTKRVCYGMIRFVRYYTWLLRHNSRIFLRLFTTDHCEHIFSRIKEGCHGHCTVLSFIREVVRLNSIFYLHFNNYEQLNGIGQNIKKKKNKNILTIVTKQNHNLGTDDIEIDNDNNDTNNNNKIIHICKTNKAKNIPNSFIFPKIKK